MEMMSQKQLAKKLDDEGFEMEWAYDHNYDCHYLVINTPQGEFELIAPYTTEDGKQAATIEFPINDAIEAIMLYSEKQHIMVECVMGARNMAGYYGYLSIMKTFRALQENQPTEDKTNTVSVFLNKDATETIGQVIMDSLGNYIEALRETMNNNPQKSAQWKEGYDDALNAVLRATKQTPKNESGENL